MNRVREIVIGTRGSRLALVQANAVADALRQAHPRWQFRIETIATRGDAVLDQGHLVADGPRDQILAALKKGHIKVSKG